MRVETWEGRSELFIFLCTSFMELELAGAGMLQKFEGVVGIVLWTAKEGGRFVYGLRFGASGFEIT